MKRNFYKGDRIVTGKKIYNLVKDIFPIYRSITGEGVRKTLQRLKVECPALQIYEIPSGTKVFDWEVPLEWNISEAYIEDEQGNRIIDFLNNNLHVVGYSYPIDKWVSREELEQYLFTEKKQPDVIPYVTSYYKERSGFCISENQKNSLVDGQYHMYIDSKFTKGSMTWGEIIIPGETKEEICFSTNICHPAMANNEASGPCVLIFLANWLKIIRRRYTYRLLFLPETIGSIAYISQHLEDMKKNIKAGFVITCVGDNYNYSYVESRKRNTLADRVMSNVLKFFAPNYKSYSFLYRGSDERQYCSPGVDLPFCVFSRSKFHEYEEYHTSADDLSFVSPEGLENSLLVLQKVVQALEYNYNYQVKVCCEPQLGKRGLYPTVSHKDTYSDVKAIQNFLAYADGENDLLAISENINVSVEKLIVIIDKLLKERLIQVV